MTDWLSSNFLRIGIAGLAADLLSRFYSQVGMTWLVDAALARGATFSETAVYAHMSTTLDLLATLLWWLFSLGFAVRVVSMLGRR